MTWYLWILLIIGVLCFIPTANRLYDSHIGGFLFNERTLPFCMLLMPVAIFFAVFSVVYTVLHLF